MPWIKQIPIEEATGVLKEEFDKQIKRMGRVFHIVHIMSQNPSTLKATGGLFEAIMYKPSPLSRIQREMLATVVSAELACPY